MLKSLSIAFSFLAIAFFMAACGKTDDAQSSASTKGDKRLSVVATTLPLYDFARTVAGPDADVHLLPPAGVGPHSYMASLKDRERLERADLVVANGLHLEEWLDDSLVAHLEKRGVKVLKTAEMIPLAELRPNGDFNWGTEGIETVPAKVEAVSPVASVSVASAPVEATGCEGCASCAAAAKAEAEKAAASGCEGCASCAAAAKPEAEKAAATGCEGCASCAAAAKAEAEKAAASGCEGCASCAAAAKAEGEVKAKATTPHVHEHGEYCSVCGGTHKGEFDAHVWMSSTGSIHQVRAIQAALSSLKPAMTEDFVKRADSLSAEITKVYADGRELLAPHRGRKLITFHDAWGYFAKEVGVKIAAVVTPIPGVDGSLKHRMELEALVKSGEVSAIFVEPQYDPAVANQIAKATGAPTFVLDTAESTPKKLEDFSFLAIVRSNIAELKRALDLTAPKAATATAAK